MRHDGVRCSAFCLSLFAFLGAGAAQSSSQTAPRPLRALVVPLSNATTSCPTVVQAKGIELEVDGRRNAMLEWLEHPAADAFLAIDQNHNGRIDNASELVGNRSLPGATGAFNALIDLADERAAKAPAIDHQHPLRRELLLWADANRNGVSEPTELRPVAAFLATIGLGMSSVPDAARRETVCRYKGWSVTAAEWTGSARPNDRNHPIHEVSLRTKPYGPREEFSADR